MLETVLNKFKGKIKNLSIFQEHLHAKSSTSYIYNLENDTWTLKADYFDNDTGKFKDVLSLDELMNLYNRIYIADNDQLYINGKEIPRETINRLLNNSQRIDGPTPVLESSKPFITEVWGWSFL